MNYITAPFSNSIVRSNFNSGNPTLDRYIKEQASQDIKGMISAVFVWLDQNKQVIGYYTLANDNVNRNEVPEAVMRKMPKSFENLPTTLLGRLAVDLKYQRIGKGQILLFDALKKAYYNSLEIGSLAVVVDPSNENAIEFYSKFGFIKLPDRGRMFLTMKTIKQTMLNE